MYMVAHTLLLLLSLAMRWWYGGFAVPHVRCFAYQDHLSLLRTYTLTLRATSQCFATLDKLLSIGYETQMEDMASKGKTSYTY